MKQKVKKAGRPPLPKGEALGKPTPIRFLESERTYYEKEAEREGLTLSEWVRKTLNKAIER